jgi:hypothetical protein
MDTTIAFVITSKVNNKIQRELLLECIRHIRIIYPEHTIYIINDNSLPSFFPLEELVDYNIELLDSIVKNGGEINPYLFILDHKCKNNKLIYIHDSVLIKKELDFSILDKCNFMPIWYSNKYIWNDIFIHENMEILKQMVFYNNHNITLYNLLCSLQKSKQFFLVTFGAMAYFDKKFVEFIKDNTNFFSIVEKFKTRNNRCLFERILSCVYMFMSGNMYSKSICGNIIDHPLSFKNTDIYVNNYNNYNNYFIKVWQGR